FSVSSFLSRTSSALTIHVLSTSYFILHPSNLPGAFGLGGAKLATGPGVGRRNDRSERDEDRASARGDRQGHPGRQSHHEPGVWRIDDRRVGDHGHALPQRQTRLRLAAKLSTTCRAADGKGL